MTSIAEAFLKQRPDLRVRTLPLRAETLVTTTALASGPIPEAPPNYAEPTAIRGVLAGGYDVPSARDKAAAQRMANGEAGSPLPRRSAVLRSGGVLDGGRQMPVSLSPALESLPAWTAPARFSHKAKMVFQAGGLLLILGLGGLTVISLGGNAAPGGGVVEARSEARPAQPGRIAATDDQIARDMDPAKQTTMDVATATGDGAVIEAKINNAVFSTETYSPGHGPRQVAGLADRAGADPGMMVASATETVTPAAMNGMILTPSVLTSGRLGDQPMAAADAGVTVTDQPAAQPAMAGVPQIGDGARPLVVASLAPVRKLTMLPDPGVRRVGTGLALPDGAAVAQAGDRPILPDAAGMNALPGRTATGKPGADEVLYEGEPLGAQAEQAKAELAGGGASVPAATTSARSGERPARRREPIEDTAGAAAADEQPRGLRVEGIFYDKTRPMALLSGSIAEVGSRVGEAEVVEIRPGAVTVRIGGQQKVLRP